MPRFSDLSRIPRPALFLMVAAVVAGGAFWSTRRTWQKPDPMLAVPSVALASLQAKTLYYNAPARPWLITQRADLLTLPDLDAGSDRTREFVQAMRNPKLFRQLDRKYRFDALLIMGDPSESKALLDRLVETKDWTLRAVDHTGLVFRRDAGKAWELADFAPVRAQMAATSAQTQATILAQTASKLMAVAQPEAALQLLEEGARLAPKNADIANGLAVYHLERGEWQKASEQVERALSADRKSLAALSTKTQLLYGTKHFAEAFELSRKVIDRMPPDPVRLFQHAKIAHEAHAYKAEIEALEKLITWADLEGRPVGGYQIYLGQAYTTTGNAKGAIDNYMAALNDPDLPDDQRAFARENIARIKKRTGQ